MPKNDTIQTISTSSTLNERVDDVRKELDAKIGSKISEVTAFWVAAIFAAALGGGYLLLTSQITTLNDKVGQLTTSIAVINQKMDDSRAHR